MSKLKPDDEIAYTLSNNEDSTVWKLEIGARFQISEEEFYLCLESFVADWFKKNTGSKAVRDDKAKH